MESVPTVRVGFFPLDEQLRLVAGSLSPTNQQQLVHLTTWMPFERAVQMFQRFTGVQISEATARRHTYQIGEAAESVQNAQAEKPEAHVADGADSQERLIVSPDGAMVPLIGGQWAEVKTVVVGKVARADPEGEVHSTQLSYFSRMLDAQTFTEQASGELLHRGVDQAKEVCAVMDGAEWIDGFVDWQCKQAVRILDFAHAAEYVNQIGQLAQAAGSPLPQDWLPSLLHGLKHNGPSEMLRIVQQLRDRHPNVEEIAKKVSYLQKREARMQYHHYQAAGWPIGSGIVESGNKVVMQARLKGPGMHWQPTHVNPMLALRTSACNDRWDETILQGRTHLHQRRLDQRRKRQHDRYEFRLHSLLVRILLLKTRSKPPAPVAAAAPPSSGSSRPSATHPWRRPLLAKK
jgi:hypothetical protein